MTDLRDDNLRVAKQCQNQLDAIDEEAVERKASPEFLAQHTNISTSLPFFSCLLACVCFLTKKGFEQWKETVPPKIQDLYTSMIHNLRNIQTFHLWLRLLDENLVPNIRNLTVHYHTVHSKNDGYNLVRISFRANPDVASNRKTQILILAFSPPSPNPPPASSPSSLGGADNPTLEGERIPWDSFLEDIENQHQKMYTKGQLDGDYDCFVAYNQYARLYTLEGAEHPNIRECWVSFSAERMQNLGIQALWSDPNDLGPVFEFKTHYTMLMHLLRAFAWNINIPYVFKLRRRSDREHGFELGMVTSKKKT